MADLSELTNVPSAPPPPPEVKVRTLRSDLESMARSGGGMPRFENVRVSGAVMGTPAGAGDAAEKKNPLMAIVVAIVALAAVAAVAYFAYTTFFAQPSSESGTLPQTSATQDNAAQTAANAGAASTHISLFKKVVDETLVVTFLANGNVKNAADLQTYGQKMLGALATADKNSTFIEVNAKASDGHDLSIGELLVQAAAPIFDQQFLAAHFNPDATFFVYRDANGSWPGYVIALNPTENWLFLQNDVKKLEASPAIANLFLVNPGTPSPDGFTDGLIANTAVRGLSFGSSASFVYGWFTGGYLILSTSPDGFAQAVARL